MPSPLDITDRVVVVIGATSGLGECLALGLAEHGAVVVPSGRRPDRLKEICDRLESAGRPTLVQTVDVGHRASIDTLRDAVLARYGRVDVIVNAAGITAREPTARVSEAAWSRIIDTNVGGVLRACQSFYEPLKASGRGRVVNIASLASFVAFHGVAAYSASKAAVLALTRNLACEWAGDGISVNALTPGVFPTALNRGLLEGTPRGDEILMRTPTHRFGRPEELLGAAILLSSDGASFITGTSIAVDGGYLASGVNS